MTLANFLALCAFLLVFATLVGIVMLFWWIDEKDRKTKEAKREKFKREILKELRVELDARMDSHFCNCHCDINTPTEV